MTSTQKADLDALANHLYRHTGMDPDFLRASFEGLRHCVTAMAEDSFWNEERRGSLTNALPDYRLSKFQRALPAPYAAEMIQEYLLDLEGAVRLSQSSVAIA